MLPDPKDKAPDPKPDETWADDQQKRGYYYDDAHGYESYDPDADDDVQNKKDGSTDSGDSSIPTVRN